MVMRRYAYETYLWDTILNRSPNSTTIIPPSPLLSPNNTSTTSHAYEGPSQKIGLNNGMEGTNYCANSTKEGESEDDPRVADDIDAAHAQSNINNIRNTDNIDETVLSNDIHQFLRGRDSRRRRSIKYYNASSKPTKNAPDTPVTNAADQFQLSKIGQSGIVTDDVNVRPSVDSSSTGTNTNKRKLSEQQEVENQSLEDVSQASVVSIASDSSVNKRKRSRLDGLPATVNAGNSQSESGCNINSEYEQEQVNNMSLMNDEHLQNLKDGEFESDEEQQLSKSREQSDEGINDNDAWDHYFKELCNFKDMNGHTIVPKVYPANQFFSTWVYGQHNLYRKDNYQKNDIDEKRFKKLEEIGFFNDKSMKSLAANPEVSSSSKLASPAKRIICTKRAPPSALTPPASFSHPDQGTNSPINDTIDQGDAFTDFCQVEDTTKDCHQNEDLGYVQEEEEQSLPHQTASEQEDAKDDGSKDHDEIKEITDLSKVDNTTDNCQQNELQEVVNTNKYTHYEIESSSYQTADEEEVVAEDGNCKVNDETKQITTQHEPNEDHDFVSSHDPDLPPKTIIGTAIDSQVQNDVVEIPVKDEEENCEEKQNAVETNECSLENTDHSPTSNRDKNDAVPSPPSNTFFLGLCNAAKVWCNNNHIENQDVTQVATTETTANTLSAASLNENTVTHLDDDSSVYQTVDEEVEDANKNDKDNDVVESHDKDEDTTEEGRCQTKQNAVDASECSIKTKTTLDQDDSGPVPSPTSNTFFLGLCNAAKVWCHNNNHTENQDVTHVTTTETTTHTLSAASPTDNTVTHLDGDSSVYQKADDVLSLPDTANKDDISTAMDDSVARSASYQVGNECHQKEQQAIDTNECAQKDTISTHHVSQQRIFSDDVHEESYKTAYGIFQACENKDESDTQEHDTELLHSVTEVRHDGERIFHTPTQKERSDSDQVSDRNTPRHSMTTTLSTPGLVATTPSTFSPEARKESSCSNVSKQATKPQNSKKNEACSSSVDLDMSSEYIQHEEEMTDKVVKLTKEGKRHIGEAHKRFTYYYVLWHESNTCRLIPMRTCGLFSLETDELSRECQERVKEVGCKDRLMYQLVKNRNLELEICSTHLKIVESDAVACVDDANKELWNVNDHYCADDHDNYSLDSSDLDTDKEDFEDYIHDYSTDSTRTNDNEGVDLNNQIVKLTRDWRNRAEKRYMNFTYFHVSQYNSDSERYQLVPMISSGFDQDGQASSSIDEKLGEQGMTEIEAKRESIWMPVKDKNLELYMGEDMCLPVKSNIIRCADTGREGWHIQDDVFFDEVVKLTNDGKRQAGERYSTYEYYYVFRHDQDASTCQLVPMVTKGVFVKRINKKYRIRIADTGAKLKPKWMLVQNDDLDLEIDSNMCQVVKAYTMRCVEDADKEEWYIQDDEKKQKNEESTV